MTDPGYQTIEFQAERAVAILTLARPQRLNAINQLMVDELLDAQARVAEDDAINALVVHGAGRSFCAGFDLQESDQGTTRPGVAETRDLLQRDFDMTMGFWDCPKPTISAVHGHCLAGGCELALACDITIAAGDARFGEPELRFGAGIVCLILPWLTGPKQAKELLFTGNDRVSAERALAIGLINKVVPEGEALNAALEMAHGIAVMDTHAMRLTKTAVNRSYDMMGMRDALRAALELDVTITTLDTPDRLQFREISKRDGLKPWSAHPRARAHPDTACSNSCGAPGLPVPSIR
jgi:enoyl-CoA hydratase